MMEIVCKTFKGVKALETYDKEGRINKMLVFTCSGLLSGSTWMVDMYPYVGDFVANDPQRRLALLKPSLPTGECPHGFLGFAVNKIDLENINLSCLTINGHGLRETPFYSLFSCVQVYKTRSEMQLAHPCISEGALYLDGGMVRSNGVFTFGESVVSGLFATVCSLPFDYVKTQIHKMQPDAAGKYPNKCSLDSAMKTLKAGGPFNFYTGFPIYCIRIAPHVMFIEEAERSLHDAIMIIRRALKNSTVVVGGGAIDVINLS
ncbi:hypothetical protein GIB67_025568 [Kingdonia uniflora]|uniref:Uncharacterized protein n=1 Tax=Kingdonia uniflora TaxID=39325 RepID=A0A7J7M0F4_9MAGN|nr:hypothetical protein GIB67_025568 [Kingdonia uniflora]